MIVWPLVALVGFLAVTAFVIAMGTRSTARYEAEQELAAEIPAEIPAVPAEALGAARAA
jgi:hypothetical protein